jgi:hypothetical protein
MLDTFAENLRTMCRAHEMTYVTAQNLHFSENNCDLNHTVSAPGQAIIQLESTKIE